MSSNQNCTGELPLSEDYLADLNDAQIGFIVVCSCLTLISFVILIDNVIFIRRSHRAVRQAVATSLWLVALSPILSIICIMSILIPRSYLFGDVLTSVSVSFVMYKFIQHVRAYVRHYDHLQKQVFVSEIRFDVMPLCFLCCIPPVPFSMKKVNILKMLVLQYAVVNMVVTVLTMYLWLDDKYTPGNFSADNAFPYLLIIRVSAAVIAIYALGILYELCATSLKFLYMKQKYIALKLTVFCVNIQTVLFSILLSTGVFKSSGCVPAVVAANYAEYVTFSFELFLITLLNFYSYRRTVPQNEVPANTEDTKREEPANGTVPEVVPVQQIM